jgi:glycosyltransferase involved in cell wall biosynthesis
VNIWYLSPYAGGPGIGKANRAYHLARAWDALGHSATIFPARFHHLLDREGELPPETTVDEVRYAALPARRYTGNGVARLLNMADYCRAVWRLRKDGAARYGRPDAIIVSSPHPFAIFPAAKLARKFGATLVFEVRDLWPLSITEINGTPKWHPFVLLAWVAERFAYRRAETVASLLGAAEPSMRERGLAAGKFVFVPNGIDAVAEPPSSPPSTDAGRVAAETIGGWRSENRLVVIHPGSQGAPNALDRLLDAASVLKTKGLESRFGFLLVGDGTQTDALRQRADSAGLFSIAFIPPVPKQEALWLTARSDIGYAGARNHERVYRHGISFNKIMDFMQAGLPVVLPLAAGGDPVSASACGIVTGDDSPVAIAAAFERLLAMSPPERMAMGERGREYCRREFDYAQIARRYADAIERSRLSKR